MVETSSSTSSSNNNFNQVNSTPTNSSSSSNLSLRPRRSARNSTSSAQVPPSLPSSSSTVPPSTSFSFTSKPSTTNNQQDSDSVSNTSSSLAATSNSHLNSPQISTTAPATPASSIASFSAPNSQPLSKTRAARSARESREADIDPPEPTAQPEASSAQQSSSALTRKGKGKQKDVTSARRSRRVASNPVTSTSTASAPSSTAKGKKRAIDSVLDDQASSSSSSAPPPTAAANKKRRNTSSGSYNLRTRPGQSLTMLPKKNNASTSRSNGDSSKGASASKAKGARSRNPRQSKASTSSNLAECSTETGEDAGEQGGMEIDVEDADEVGEKGEDRESQPEVEGENPEVSSKAIISADEDDEDDHEDEEDQDDDDEDGEGRQGGQYDDEDGEDEDGYGGMGGYGINLSAMSGYMSGLSTRFRTLLESLRKRNDPSGQLVALQELAELLSISNEETLAGYFPTESFVKELVYIMGGPKPADPKTVIRATAVSDSEGEGGEDDEDEEMEDLTFAGVAAASKAAEEDEADAAAIAAAQSGMEDNGEMMLLASRCLANLMEALPYATHSVVSSGAIPVLNSKLMEIQFIDLAEQVLQTLEKISTEFPTAIVKEGGLTAMLQFLDFFNMHVQRTAMNAAANCCRRLTTEVFPMIRDVLPIIQNVLTYSDQRLVESACRCVVSAVESYRHQPEILEQLLTGGLVTAVNSLLLPSSSTSTGSGASTTNISAGTYTNVLKALGTGAKASPKVAVTMLENNLVETLYHLLTGSPAPAEDGSGGAGPAGTGATHANSMEIDSQNQGGADNAAVAVLPVAEDGETATGAVVADMAVLQNLAQRPKEQVQEALSLVAELLPPLPRDGVFDSRTYSEKAYQKKRSADKKAAKEKARSSLAAASAETGEEDISAEVKPEVTDEAAEGSNSRAPAAAPRVSTSSKPERVKSERELAKEQAQLKRVEMLKGREGLMKRFTQLVLPTLVEVYAASVALHVRGKAILGILKLLSYVEAEPLREVLHNVPLAGFVASILSSRDHSSLVLGGLQIVEILTTKLPDVYKALLRREGVMWEIEDIASRDPSTSAAKKVKNEAQLSLPGGASATISSTTSTSTAATPARTSSAAAMPALAAGIARSVAASSSKSSGAPPTPAEMEDANIWRARVLGDRYAQEEASSSSDGAKDALKALKSIKKLVQTLSTKAEEDQEVAKDTVGKITSLFVQGENPISSFELLRSGLVDGLYSFATGSSEKLPKETRRRILIEALNKPGKEAGGESAAPGSVAGSVVRRLQEALSRLDSVDITSTLNSAGDERRGTASTVSRQIKLRLLADEGTEAPRSMTNMIVTIHAIASFSTLHDYVRPRLAATDSASAGGAAGGAGGSTTSRLQGMLAAFAAAASGGPALGGSGASGSSLSARAAALASAAGRTSGSGAESKEKGKAAAPKAGASASSSSSSDANATGSASGSGSVANGTAASTSTSTSEGKKVTRRSSRLSGKSAEDSESRPEAASGADAGEASGITADDDEEDDEDGDGPPPGWDEEMARQLMQGLLEDGGMDDGQFSDDYDDEVFDDEMGEGGGPSGSAPEKTVNLDVSSEGGKLEAKTADGTRVPTPSIEAPAASGSGTPSDSKGKSDSEASKTAASTSTGTGAPTGTSAALSPFPAPSSSAPGGSSHASYSAAAASKPTDWHLVFTLNGIPVSMDKTIYSVVHQIEMANASNASAAVAAPSSAASRNVWGNVYTLKFKKVPGPAPTAAVNGTPEPESEESQLASLPASLSPEHPFGKILQLLRVLHDLNSEWREERRQSMSSLTPDESKAPALNESVFVNNKLTAKLNRQLEEHMIVASGCLPDWSTELPRVFPFLFPFEARFSFLQSTAFGYTRLIARWQSQHARSQGGNNNSNSSLREDPFATIARQVRQKVRVPRARLLDSAFKVFELYGSGAAVLEIEYHEEVGTGLGPTLEFYSLVSREFARKRLGAWRDSNESDSTGEFVVARQGLFPAPLAQSETGTENGKGRLQVFRTLGQFVAKALIDSRIVDLNFSPVFLKAVLNQHIPSNLGTLSAVDSTMAHSLESLRLMDAETLTELALDFTLPGYSEMELHKGGKDQVVTPETLEIYISEVVSMALKEGIAPLVRSFRQGFNTIFPLRSMSSFTADELVMLFGNTEEDWSEDTLQRSVKPDHGLTSESSTFKDMISIMARFSTEDRRNFLQWLTGAPKLPIGGFGGLHPQLTVVKRPHEAPLGPDDYLPSVMTCVNYLKMPLYSNKETMKKRLDIAMREGSTSFHLS